MSGNEILLNMQNYEFFRMSEMIGSLTALYQKDKSDEHDWNDHPTVTEIFAHLKKHVDQLSFAELKFLALATDRLRYEDDELWVSLSKNLLRLLHKFQSSDFPFILDLFCNRKDVNGDFIRPDRAEHEFFARLITILPMHVKKFTNEQLIRCYEICIEKNLGSERLFYEYIYFYIEKRVHKFDLSLYLRALRLLGDTNPGGANMVMDDPIFWADYMFPFIYERPFNQEEAQKVWNGLIRLKLSNPVINTSHPIQYIEFCLKKFETVEGFGDMDQEEKNMIRLYGEISSDPQFLKKF